MTLLELIKKHGWIVFSDSDSSCPCGSAYIGGIHINVHCWRTFYENCKCKYAGIHLKNKNEDVDKKTVWQIGQALKKDIEEAYHCECRIVVEK